MFQRITSSSILVPLALFCTACGGGGGSDTDTAGTVLHGSLIQGSAAAAERLAHSSGEFIGDVDVCALGACSRTDANGLWGFAVDQVPESFELTLSGHGISDSVVVTVPPSAKEITIELENEGAEGVFVHAVMADGATVEQAFSHHDE